MNYQSIKMKKEDRSMLSIMHYSQLLVLVTGVGGFLVPFIIWIVKRDEIDGVDEHGKAIVNFQASMFLYSIIAVPLILAIGLGILMLIAISILVIVFPIINGMKVNDDKPIDYPFTIKFLK